MSHQDAKIRVAIVDDHAMVREGLRTFLQYAPDIDIVAEVGNGVDAVELCRREQLHVILMDLVMPGELDGVLATKEITSGHPDIHIVALTSFQDVEKTLAVIDAGAISYLQKDVNPDDLLYAIRQAAQGRSVLEPSALQALKQSGAQEQERAPLSSPPLQQAPTPQTPTPLFESLTAREQQVLEAMASGMSNKEIGAALGITEKTAKVHVSHILAKLGVYDRTQAVITATKLGFIHLT